jgi:hypothetical protein
LGSRDATSQLNRLSLANASHGTEVLYRASERDKQPKGTKIPSPTEKALLSHAPNTRHAIEDAIKDHETQRFALSQGLSTQPNPKGRTHLGEALLSHDPNTRHATKAAIRDHETRPFTPSSRAQSQPRGQTQQKKPY